MLAVGAYNQEVEFDISFAPGVTSWPSGYFGIRVASNGKWGGGGIQVADRLGVPGTTTGAAGATLTPVGVGQAGHYKVSVVGTTARVTFPSGDVFTYTDMVRTADQVHVSIDVTAKADQKVYVDNLVVKQVGY